MARVLVADDETHILSVMMEILAQAGHEVVGVQDGEAALVELRKGGFDVALIDVMMPKMDGYHVATQIHGLENPPRVVIVTSRHFDDDRMVVQAAGAAAFLSKPFSNRELMEVVETLVKIKKNQ